MTVLCQTGECFGGGKVLPRKNACSCRSGSACCSPDARPQEFHQLYQLTLSNFVFVCILRRSSLCSRNVSITNVRPTSSRFADGVSSFFGADHALSFLVDRRGRL